MLWRGCFVNCCHPTSSLPATSTMRWSGGPSATGSSGAAAWRSKSQASWRRSRSSDSPGGQGHSLSEVTLALGPGSHLHATGLQSWSQSFWNVYKRRCLETCLDKWCEDIDEWNFMGIFFEELRALVEWKLMALLRICIFLQCQHNYVMFTICIQALKLRATHSHDTVMSTLEKCVDL